MPDVKGWFRGLTGRSNPVPADEAAPPLFAIRDRPSGAIVFLGRVTRP